MIQYWRCLFFIIFYINIFPHLKLEFALAIEGINLAGQINFNPFNTLPPNKFIEQFIVVTTISRYLAWLNVNMYFVFLILPTNG